MSFIRFEMRQIGAREKTATPVVEPRDVRLDSSITVLTIGAEGMDLICSSLISAMRVDRYCTRIFTDSSRFIKCGCGLGQVLWRAVRVAQG